MVHCTSHWKASAQIYGSDKKPELNKMKEQKTTFLKLCSGSAGSPACGVSGKSVFYAPLLQSMVRRAGFPLLAQPPPPLEYFWSPMPSWKQTSMCNAQHIT